MSRRFIYLTLTTLIFIALILIVKFFSSSQFIRGFIGDVIIMWLLYTVLKIFHDFHALKLAAFTLTVAYITEFIQYLKIAAIFGLEHNVLAQLLFGTVFDPYDLIAYTLGTALIYFIDTKLVSKVI